MRGVPVSMCVFNISVMQLFSWTSPLAPLVTAATFFAEAQAQTSQLVYSQNFNSAAIDTTGTGLNDGSNMVDNVSFYNTRVWDSTSWGALPSG
jgi:hypothetical protein